MRAEHLDRARRVLGRGQRAQAQADPAWSEPDDDDDPYATISGDDYPDLDLHDQQRRALVLRCVDALPPMQRTLVTLYHLDELPILDICTIVGAPEGTVKNALFRARRRLRDMLIEHREELT